jgi:hypothetical protein
MQNNATAHRAQRILTPRLLCRHTVRASAATLERLLTHRNKEVVVAIRELLRMQEPDSNSCKMEKNESICTGITMKSNALSLEI